LATSSSAERAARRALSAYLAIGIAIVIATAIAVSRTSGAAAMLATFSGAAGLFMVAVVAAVPRLRSVRALDERLRRLAAGEIDAHGAGLHGEFGVLAVRLDEATAALGGEITALRQAQGQLAALLNASADAIVAVSADGRVRYANDAARALFATPGTAGVTLGRPFIEAVRDHDLNELVLAAAERGERSVRVVAYGPGQRWLQATAVPIAGAGDWAALAAFHDLTEVRRIERLRRDFISNVSHELRTPLAGIRAAAETLREGALEEPEAAREFVGHIEREADRMTQLVEELLELSRIESGEAPLRPAGLEAGELVREVVRRFAGQAERAGVALRAAAPDGRVELVGDAERLERALGNLVANAIKFTPRGGSVVVSAEAEEGGVVLRVADSGIGIEPAEQARVWERFYKADRARGGGTGLGLAIVKHIVQAHGGSVALESRVGRGSTFTLRLPRR